MIRQWFALSPDDGRPVAVCRYLDARDEAAREELSGEKLNQATSWQMWLVNSPDAEDGRTLIEMRNAEPSYSVVVETANVTEEGTSIGFDGSWGTFLAGCTVKVGDVVTFWDGGTAPGFGQRHGYAVNGELIKWLTPFERIAERVQWLADHDRKQRERLEQGAEKRANDYAALPAPLKARLDRFEAERADFWKDGGDYELFCCVEAAKIAEHLRPRVEAGGDVEEIVKAFYDDRDDQAKVPIDDGHSGNTFGGACSLAAALLRGEVF